MCSVVCNRSDGERAQHEQAKTQAPDCCLRAHARSSGLCCQTLIRIKIPKVVSVPAGRVSTSNTRNIYCFFRTVVFCRTYFHVSSGAMARPTRERARALIDNITCNTNKSWCVCPPTNSARRIAQSAVAGRLASVSTLFGSKRGRCRTPNFLAKSLGHGTWC